MTGEPSAMPRCSRRSARPFQPASARAIASGDAPASRAPRTRQQAGVRAGSRRQRGLDRAEVVRAPSSRSVRAPGSTPAPGSLAGPRIVTRRMRAAECAGKLDRAGVVGVDDRPVVGPLEGDDAALGLEVGGEAAVLVDVIGPDVRDAGDLRAGRADGEVVRGELGDAPGGRPRRERALEQVGRRPGVVGGRVARAQRLDAARAQHRLGRRAVVVLPALPVTPSTGTGAKRSSRSAAPERRLRLAAIAGSGAQGESRRTSSATPSRVQPRSASSSASSPGGDRVAHAGGPESSSSSSTSGRRRIAAIGRLSSRW